MQAQNIIFPAQILRGAGAVSRIGEVCGLVGFTGADYRRP